MVFIVISYRELDQAGLLDKYNNPTFESDAIPKIALQLRRDEVVNAYMSLTGMTKQEIEHTYEGGIDNWIGFGSVTCFEFGGGTFVGYGYYEIQLAIG